MTMFGSQWLANAGASYEIDQSIRFNDDDSAHMARNGFGQSPTSSTDCTISVWVKRGNNLGSNSTIFYGGDPNGSTSESLRFGTGDQLQFSQASSDYDLKTNQLFRDPSAWYHIVVVLDTDNGTEGNRAALYVNGSKVTSFATENYPGSSYSTNFTANSSSVEHVIGSNAASGNASQFFDGYIAEFNFIDGQVLTPASFGETNDNGVWIPKKYSAAYGANGFYIKGESSSDLGNDSSGNDNDFTSSGLAAADQMSDSPTNNHCTLNPLWVDGHTLSDGNLVASAAADSAAIGTMAFDPTDSAGFYFEAKVTTAATYPNVGIRTVESPSQVGAVTSLSGNSTGRFSFTGSNGQFSDAGSGSSYGSAWAGTADKVIGVLVKAGALYFSIDGTIQNSGTAAKTGLTGLMLPTVFYDAGSGTAASWEMRFDASDWSTTPSGYKAITTDNLATPSIKDGSAYFHTQLYTGNGSSGLAITNDANAGDFEADLLIIGPRSNGDNKVWFDDVRGTTKRIKSNSADPGDTDSTAQLTFESDGFDLDTTDVNFNGSGRTYVAWQWKKGATPGFDIVEYTGNKTNRTISHSLGVPPEWIVIKDYSNTESWIVGHNSIGWTKNLYLNLTNAEATSSSIWQDTAPTSSVFSIGTSDGVNKVGSHIAYLWASVPGFSKFGSYTGNGNADGPFVYTGFKPALVILKVSSNSPTGWIILDNKRDTFNSVNHVLQPNNSETEVSGSDNWDFNSNGFKLRTTWAAANGSGYTVTYVAFAEHPFANPDGAPATAR
jgi:hypothetical protein